MENPSSHNDTVFPLYISAKEASDRLGLVPDYITRLCREKNIKGMQVGKRWFIESADVERYRIEHGEKKEIWKKNLSLERKNLYKKKTQKKEVKDTEKEKKKFLPSLYVTEKSLLKKSASFAFFFLLTLFSVSTLWGMSLNNNAFFKEGSFFYKADIGSEEKKEDGKSFFVDLDKNTQSANVFDIFNSLFRGAAERIYTLISGQKKEDILLTNSEEEENEEMQNNQNNTEQKEEVIAIRKPPQLPLSENENEDEEEKTLIIDANVVQKKDVSVEGTLRTENISLLNNLSVGNNLSVSGVGVFANSLQSESASFSQMETNTAIVNDALTVNGPLTANQTLTANGGIQTNGANIDAGSGEIYASNLLSSISAGRNVRIDFSDPRNPEISVRDMSSSVSIPNVGEVLNGNAGEIAFYSSAGRKVSGSNILSIANDGIIIDGKATTTEMHILGGFFQDTFPSCATASDKLLYNETTGKFFCGIDAGATEGVVDLYQDGVLAATGITVQDFKASDFNVTFESGFHGAAGADISIDYATSGITRKGQNENITGEWSFSGDASFDNARVERLTVNEFFQDALSNCSAESQNILYNATTGKFFCGSDESGSGTAVSSIKEEGVVVSAPSLSLDFKGEDFTVSTPSTSTEAYVALDYASSGITRKNQDENILGTWNFANALTANTFIAQNTTATSTFPQVSMNALSLGGDYFTSLTGSGLRALNGFLQLESSVPNRTGAFDGQILSWDTASGSWILDTVGGLGVGDGSFLGLGDTPISYSTIGAIPFTNQAQNALIFSDTFTFDDATGVFRIVGDGVFTGNITTGTINAESGVSTFSSIETDSLESVDIETETLAVLDTLTVSEFYQNGLANCNEESQTLLYNSSTGFFECGVDAGSEGALRYLKSNDVEIIDGALALDFLGSDFTLSIDGVHPKEGNVSIDYPSSGITRKNQNEIIAGEWDFTNGLSASVFSAKNALATSTFAGGVDAQNVNTEHLYTHAFFQTDFDTPCNGVNDKVIYDPTTGKFSCGFDGGSVTAQSVWATSSDSSFIYPSNVNTIVVIGNNATSTNDSMLEVDGKITAENYRSTVGTSTFVGIEAEYASTSVVRVDRFFQNSFTEDCSGESRNVLYDPVLGIFSCGNDESGTGTAISNIKEGGVSRVAPSLSIDFSGSDFSVTAQGASLDEGFIEIDYFNSGITRKGQDENITGEWSFSDSLTAERFVASSLLATSTLPYLETIGFSLGDEYIESFSGNGLSIVSNILRLDDDYVKARAGDYVAENQQIPQRAGTTFGDLLWWNDGVGEWEITATSTLGITLETIAGILPVEKGGTGISTPPQINEVLIGNGSGGYTHTTIGGLGVGNGTFLGLDDTPSAFVQNAIPFVSSSNDELLFSSSFTFDETLSLLSVLGSITTESITATVGTSTFVGIEASEVEADTIRADRFFSDNLPHCRDESETLLYDATTGFFICGTDSGAEGGVVTIKENDVAIVTGALAIDFVGNDFNVTEVGTDGRIALDYVNSGITRRNQNESITGVWDFSNVLTAPYFTATNNMATSTFFGVELSALSVGGDHITDFSGNGLTVSSGELGIDDTHIETQIQTYVNNTPSIPNVSGDSIGDLLKWTGTEWGTSTLADIGLENTFEALLDTPSYENNENAILFINAVGNAVSASSNFVYNSLTDRMAIGTSTPSSNEKLTLFGVDNGIRFAFDATTFVTMRANSLGVLEIDSSNESLDSIFELGDGSSKNAYLRFFGDANSFSMGRNDADNTLRIALGHEIDQYPIITIGETGYVGIGKAPTMGLSVAGDTWFDSTQITFASSSSSLLTVKYQAPTENDIVDGEEGAWVIKSALLGDIFSIDTSGAFSKTSLLGDFDLNNGAMLYDATNNLTSIENLRLGNTTFETNAGQKSWIDMGIDGTAIDGTVMSYSAQIDTSPILTVWSEANGGNAVKKKVVIGNITTPVLTSSNIPENSLIVSNGALCVQSEFGNNCASAVRNNTRPIGVVSTDPGLLLGGFGREDPFKEDHHISLALAGRVPVRVDGKGGDISVGDHIAVSDNGIGKRLDSSGYSIGIALENSTFSEETEIKEITVFVGVQYIFAKKHFAIDENTGNVGIGTEHPEYTLHVKGEVGAESFVNISTREEKKDIGGLTVEKRGKLIEDFYSLEVKEYRYKEENGLSPLRLGFIAEEVPSSILSVRGEGIDLYKLSTLTVLGVQNLEERVKILESFLGFSLNDMPLESPEENKNGLMALIFESLKEFGVKISKNLASFVGLETENLTVGTEEKPTGIQLYDEKTNEPYCVSIVNGNLKEKKGLCGESEEENIQSPIGEGGENIQEENTEEPSQEGALEEDIPTEESSEKEEETQEEVQSEDAEENAGEENIEEDIPTEESSEKEEETQEEVQSEDAEENTGELSGEENDENIEEDIPTEESSEKEEGEEGEEKEE